MPKKINWKKKQSHCGVFCKQLFHYKIKFPVINIQVRENRDSCCLLLKMLIRFFKFVLNLTYLYADYYFKYNFWFDKKCKILYYICVAIII